MLSSKRPEVFIIPWTDQKRIYCSLYLHFIINILNIKIIQNLGNKTVLYLIQNRILNGFVRA